MNQAHARSRRPIVILVLVALLLIAVMLMARGQQVSLPLTGIQSNGR